MKTTIKKKEKIEEKEKNNRMAMKKKMKNSKMEFISAEFSAGLLGSLFGYCSNVV